MVRVRDLKLSLRAFIQTYPWRKIDPVPSAPRRRALADCRVALVSSAGLVVPGDEPFSQSMRGGDFSHRWIPADTAVQFLEEHHRSDAFDHSGIHADRNMGMPLERLHELATAGEIGAVAPHHISLMGSITAPGRLLRDTVPVVVERLAADEVDVALLVPV